MEASFITLNEENIEKEHICCAFSDKKCKDGYELKKEWLKKEFDNGKFITTDLSTCMDSRFDKVVKV